MNGLLRRKDVEAKPVSLRITELDEMPDGEFEDLYSATRVKPHEHLSDWADERKLMTYELSSLQRGLRSGSTVLAVRLSGNLVALLAVSKLGFDSDFFQFPMGRISPLMVSDSVPMGQRNEVTKGILRKALSKVKREGIRQVTVRVPPREYDIIQTCTALKFDFIDVLVTYAIDMTRVDKERISPPKDFVIRTKRSEDIQPLMRVAGDSFVKDRFHSDKRFDQKIADRFHSKWIENSLTGVAADEVIVAEIDGRPIGFTTLKINRELSDAIGIRSCSMILSAVDSSVRGRGIYRHMIAGGLRWFMGKSDVTDLGTQIDNLAVQRAWCGLGFKPASHMITMHWWDGQS